MLRQRVEAALEVGERAARTWLAVHGHARDRAGGALTCFDHGREGRVIAPLAPAAFARHGCVASAFGIARTIVAAAGARGRARCLDDGAVLADHDRVAHAGEVLRVAENAQEVEAPEGASRLLVQALL